MVTCQSETNSSTQQTSQSQTTDEAIAEWEAQKCSMFIHFGVYSELSGVWNDERVEYGYCEQDSCTQKYLQRGVQRSSENL